MVIDETTDIANSSGPEHSVSDCTIRQGDALAVLRTLRAEKAKSMTRNRRTVWVIATEPYSEAPCHLPDALIGSCIMAGTSQRGRCPRCSTPWRKVFLETSGGRSIEYHRKRGSADSQTRTRKMPASVRARPQAGEPHDNPFPGAQDSGFGRRTALMMTTRFPEPSVGAAPPAWWRSVSVDSSSASSPTQATS